MARSANDLRQLLVEIFVVNEHLNQLLLENLDGKAWRAKPARNMRTIAAIFCHMHNVRRKWVRLSAPHLKLPPQLDRTRCTQKQARSALAESARRCTEMIGEALDDGREFRRDGWARPWPAGAAMVAYMVAHEAHHRGQVCMLAHELGFPLGNKVTSEMWSWERLWRLCGYTHPR